MQIHFCTATCAKSLGGRDYEEENWERFIGCKASPTTFTLPDSSPLGIGIIYTHSGEKFSGCVLIWIFQPSWEAFGVISHHRLHPTLAQVHFPLHSCWIPASETRCHGLQLALQLLQKSAAGAATKMFLAKRVSQLLLSTEGRSLPAVADGDVFPGSCVNQMKREQLFPLACVGQEMGRNKPEL